MKKWIPIVLILTSIIISLVAYPHMPDQVPTHWNMQGEVDDYSSKLFNAVLMPGIILFIYITLVVTPKIDPKKENYKKFTGMYFIIVIATILLLIAVQIITTVIALGYDINISIIASELVGVLFIVIGNYLPRARQNFFVGVKTPWTLMNELVWDKTHRLSSKVFVIAGIVFMLSVFLPATIQIYVILATIVSLVIIPIVSSYIFYKQIVK